MPLVELRLPFPKDPLSGDVHTFLREANRRLRQFERGGGVPGFIPCDFELAYVVLTAVAEWRSAPSGLFCEWGSGLGVVTCLAAMLDFDAVGIEIEGTLTNAASRLADDFELPVEFVRGSFIPYGADACLGLTAEFSWLDMEQGEALAEVGLATDDFDVIFAYPWPDEEWAVAALFEHYAAVGAVLVTYHAGGEFLLRHKTAA